MTRRFAAAAVLGGIALVSLVGCGRESAVPSQGSSSAQSADSGLGLTRFAAADREEAPALAGITIDGGYLDLESLRGKVVVLNAWASWCEPCKEEFPVLAAVSKSVGPDVEFVGLDVNDDDDDARAMAGRYGIEYSSISDRGSILLGTIPGVPPGAIPSTVVIDRTGRIAARVIGTVKQGMLEPVLADLVAESAGG